MRILIRMGILRGWKVEGWVVGELKERLANQTRYRGR